MSESFGLVPATNMLIELQSEKEILRDSVVLCYARNYFRNVWGFYMQNILSGAFLSILSTLLLTACSSIAIDPSSGEEIRAINIPRLEFLAGGYSNEKDSNEKPPKSVNSLSDEELSQILQKLPGTICDDSPDLCFRGFDEKDVVSGFGSLTGITSFEFVRAVKSRRNILGSKSTVSRGKILKNCLHDKSLPGYYFYKGALRLCVLMVTKIARPADGIKVRFQYFHVEATNVGVDKKRVLGDDDFDDKNVFPKAFEKTEIKISEKKAKGFKYKLYAYGTNIRIKQYWEANIPSNFGSATFEKYDAGTPTINERIKLYFNLSDKACVDMLFENYPQKTLPPTAKAGKFYCLGRCEKEVPIVNTK